MGMILSLIVNAIAVMLAAYIIPGAHVNSFGTALLVTIVMAVLNLIVKPILTILTLPITIITFGLFLFVINLIILFLADSLISGFQLDGIVSAILFAVTLSVIGSITNRIA